MKITVYKCSACAKMHYNASNMRKHVATVCAHGSLERIQGFVTVEGTATAVTARGARSKPGPKPFDMHALLRGRLPAFSDQGDDERIEYVFASGLINDLVRANCEDIPELLYNALWSTQAPEHMQSFVIYKNAIHEVETLDDETGEITYVSRGSLTRKFIKEMAVYTLELAYSIAKHSIPTREPHRIPEAHAMLERLCATTDEMTLRDAIKATESYTKRSFAVRHKMDHAFTRLSHAMSTYFPTCFTSAKS